MILATVLPIFALILAGFGFARWRGLGEEAVGLLNQYVVWVALPALLFDFLAEADWAKLNQPRFVLVFTGAMMATFALSMVLSPRVARQQRSLARRSLDALTAGYANAAYMGIPLASGLLGAAGLAAAVISALLTVCALFAFSIALVEIDLNRGHSPLAAIGKVGKSVLMNPLVASPIAGAIWGLAGVPLPGAVSAFCKMLGASATPVALVTIGMFLAQKREGGGRDAPAELTLAVVLKLAVQPLLTLALLAVIPLPAPYAAAALLLAALPTGTGPFMVAQLYRQEVALASRAILISTILSVLTISALAWWIV